MFTSFTTIVMVSDALSGGDPLSLTRMVTWFVLGPTLRILRVIPFRPDRSDLEVLASTLAALPPPGRYDRVLTEMEYPLILAALTATRGNQIKAADLLGLNRNTLRKKIRELGVSVYRSSRTA